MEENEEVLKESSQEKDESANCYPLEW